MKILVVNHGYPMKFNAGSEIYTQNLVHGLLRIGHSVRVFSRDENPFLKDFEIISKTRTSPDNIDYRLDLINVARQKDRYQSDGIDEMFDKILSEFKPDIVHINHLNHLSLGIIEIIYRNHIPIIFTLHDYWLACPRGQFLQINYGIKDFYQLCSGQESRKCAINCYSRYFTGSSKIIEIDIDYWTKWVNNRQKIIKDIVEMVDYFIAPSPSLMKRMQNEISISDNKIIYIDYGFDLDNLNGRKRENDNSIVFGYIGTHIIAKGIDYLLKAFSELNGNSKLIIFGRERQDITNYLKNTYQSERIEWKNEYINSEIIDKVFNHVDVIVTPSIWEENSPLVIHEAQQARVPVITTNMGGMADYVKHNVNGLLFNPRDVNSLREQMQKMIDNPSLIKSLGNKGYIYSKHGNVISLEEHVTIIEKIYQEVLN